MKKFILKALKHASTLAVFTAVLSSNTTCTWIIHQPEVPAQLNKFKKHI